MSTTPAYREDAYMQSLEARVAAVTEDGGIVLDRTLFFPTGGGQPGDTGQLQWSGGTTSVATTRKGSAGDSVLVLAEGQVAPGIGESVLQVLDWDRRFAHMKMHTALHLLSVVLPLPVTGGAVGAEKSRLDFLMPEPPQDRDAVEAALNDLIARDLAVSEHWITEEDLDAQPDLIKTMSVQPPRGAGKIRLVRIGTDVEQIDLQPCGGTHVARTGEIGAVRLGKIENKGKQNRRVNLHLASE